MKRFHDPAWDLEGKPSSVPFWIFMATVLILLIAVITEGTKAIKAERRAEMLNNIAAKFDEQLQVSEVGWIACTNGETLRIKLKADVFVDVECKVKYTNAWGNKKKK